jgi:hypothetical protein
MKYVQRTLSKKKLFCEKSEAQERGMNVVSQYREYHGFVLASMHRTALYVAFT